METRDKDYVPSEDDDEKSRPKKKKRKSTVGYIQMCSCCVIAVLIYCIANSFHYDHVP